MDIFKSKPKRLVGIDIGSRVIKIVELGQNKTKQIVLKNYALGTPAEKLIRKAPVDQVAALIRQLLKQAEIEARTVNMSLPAHATFLVLVDLPDMSDDEIDEAIQFEAKKYIPVPLSEVTLGWSRSHGDILLIAVPKKLAHRYAQIAQLAGLELTGLEGETFSLARAIVYGSEGRILLIDAGANSVNVSLLVDGQIRSNRTIDLSDSWPVGIVDLVTKAKKPLSKVVLAGGQVTFGQVKDLKQELDSRGYQVPVELGTPWRNVRYPKKLVGTLTGLAPLLSGAVGLALRDYDRINSK